MFPRTGVFLWRVLRLKPRRPRCARRSCELIDGGAAGAPVRKLLIVELRRHMRMPFAGHRPHHRGGVELAAIDAHRAVEPAADLERGFDDGVARQARQDRLEIGERPFRSSSFGQGAMGEFPILGVAGRFCL